MTRVFDGLDAFYAADPARWRSREQTYGRYWTSAARSSRRWRVVYVVDTGEIYAQLVEDWTRGGRTGRVEILGVLDPPDEDRFAELMTGWAQACAEPGSLAWVDARLEEAAGARRRRRGAA